MNAPTASHAFSPSATPSPADSQNLAIAWSAQLARAPEAVHTLLGRIASADLAPFANHFYAALMGDARASRYLSSQQVQQHLKPALQNWLRELLQARSGDAPRLVGVNTHVGVAHARIGIPVDLVTRGFRELRGQLQQHCAALAAGDAALLAAAIGQLDCSMDIALEAMTLAYTKASKQSSHTDTAYRLFTLMQNMGTERERQRALLLDWENSLLYGLTRNDADLALQMQPLSQSEFCLWLLHKGIPSLGESPESARILALVGEVDALLQAPLQSAPSATARMGVLMAIRERLETIRGLLASLFERVGEMDAGSDSLTSLLNRRFLPTVLKREIELASQRTSSFAIALIDLDHFKHINDTHGHTSGDLALRHVADMLNRHTRGSDYVFRLGGEEFVVVLGSVTTTQAMAIAEKLRHAIAATPLELPDGHSITITASIGVADFDGHPDYMRLLSRADAAMYTAKHGGRNRVELATRERPPSPIRGDARFPGDEAH